jgi:hypothetical protein
MIKLILVAIATIVVLLHFTFKAVALLLTVSSNAVGPDFAGPRLAYTARLSRSDRAAPR